MLEPNVVERLVQPVLQAVLREYPTLLILFKSI
jgi:hypothetical protein